MKENTYRKIVSDIVDEIFRGKLNSNDKLPSGKQLQIKYGVSRAVTNATFQKLVELDIAYSKSQKGFYVSENFSNVVRPLHIRYQYDEIKNDRVPDETILEKYHGKIEDYSHFEHVARDFYKDSNLIIKTDTIIKKGIKFDIETSVTDNYISRGYLTNIIRRVFFEEDDTFGEKLQIVEVVRYYGEKEMLAISRNVIRHDIYKLVKKESVY